MATVPVTELKPTLEKQQNNPVNEKDEDKPEKKLTVLETHGYALGRTVGAGSYATVKVAKSDRHNCQVAVKIVSKFQAPGDYLKKFLPREIEVVKGLKHSNLIRFLQAIETTHRVYIVMEYAQNGSLLDVIRRDMFIDETRSRRWFRQLLEAVDYCHERGVVHRDIKCENLLMDKDFNIKLSDFGFARGHMKPKNGIAPLSETFCGSYAYASPEILRGIPYQPQMSDIWSMGVVLFAMVYGRLPFDDSNYAQLLKQVQNKVTFPKDPKVSQPCRVLITRILAPQRTRLRIAIIRNDPWLIVAVAIAQTSTTDKSVDNIPTISTATETKVFVPETPDIPKLLTKEALVTKHQDTNIGIGLENELPIKEIQAHSSSKSIEGNYENRGKKRTENRRNL
ncbi:testis-specific serine/threonine-protein kinase 4-like [Cephus cinctus]|uniref:Testis-specific serine/threonine-protein kinase 4-like n=1 Tax=Cephus cinctus TaxID=211228 RepID=A0AAJ7BRB9_CEPCN|nr:testis-specific serine/threonine-protein kinase 4-like [Cephus cinctus]